MDDVTKNAIGEALQKSSLHGVELCRSAVIRLMEAAQDCGLGSGVRPGYVEGLRDAVEMIDTVFTVGLEIALREKAKNDEQASRSA